MNRIIIRYIKEEGMTPAEAQENLYWLIENAYSDRRKYSHTYGLYNGDPEDHDELCMWCNFHTTIHDACLDNVVPCMDERQSCSNPLDCSDCMKNTKWYRRIA